MLVLGAHAPVTHAITAAATHARRYHISVSRWLMSMLRVVALVPGAHETSGKNVGASHVPRSPSYARSPPRIGHHAQRPVLGASADSDLHTSRVSRAPRGSFPASRPRPKLHGLARSGRRRPPQTEQSPRLSPHSCRDTRQSSPNPRTWRGRGPVPS